MNELPFTDTKKYFPRLEHLGLLHAENMLSQQPPADSLAARSASSQYPWPSTRTDTGPIDPQLLCDPSNFERPPHCLSSLNGQSVSEMDIELEGSNPWGVHLKSERDVNYDGAATTATRTSGDPVAGSLRSSGASAVLGSVLETYPRSISLAGDYASATYPDAFDSSVWIDEAPHLSTISSKYPEPKSHDVWDPNTWSRERRDEYKARTIYEVDSNAYSTHLEAITQTRAKKVCKSKRQPLKPSQSTAEARTKNTRSQDSPASLYTTSTRTKRTREERDQDEAPEPEPSVKRPRVNTSSTNTNAAADVNPVGSSTVQHNVANRTTSTGTIPTASAQNPTVPVTPINGTVLASNSTVPNASAANGGSNIPPTGNRGSPYQPRAPNSAGYVPRGSSATPARSNSRGVQKWAWPACRIARYQANGWTIPQWAVDGPQHPLESIVGAPANTRWDDLSDVEITAEEILTFAPLCLAQHGVMNRLVSNAWGPTEIASAIGIAHGLTRDDGIKPDTVKHMILASDKEHHGAPFAQLQKQDQNRRRAIRTRTPTTDYTPAHWLDHGAGFKHFDRYGLEDPMLYDMGSSVPASQVPQGEAAKLLTKVIEFVVLHELKDVRLSELKTFAAEHGLDEGITPMSPDADKRALEALRRKINATRGA